tara:strand:- start:9138 stop:9764 length:627 start_codon:yes stop_codon:yes gene_type:complete
MMKKFRYSNVLILIVLVFAIIGVVLDRSQKVSVSEEIFFATNTIQTPTLEIVTATKTPNVSLSQSITHYPVTSTYSIPTSQLPTIEFYKKNGERIFLHVEVPKREEYSIGLSGRNTLVGRGMLFKFPDLVLQPFWMKDTFVELSIAFIDEEGKILQIEQMQPKSEKLIVPITLYKYAVEVPVNWYTDREITVGDKVYLGPIFSENFAQ